MIDIILKTFIIDFGFNTLFNNVSKNFNLHKLKIGKTILLRNKNVKNKDCNNLTLYGILLNIDNTHYDVKVIQSNCCNCCNCGAVIWISPDNWIIEYI